LLETHPGPLIVPTLVITEVAYFIGEHLGAVAEKQFLDDIAENKFTVDPVADEDWSRIGELVEQYENLPLGTVDASVVAAAERFGIAEIATIDRRDFSIVRPRHVNAFTLLPLNLEP
jgi:predicted nucleic acid-binding protein